MGCWRGPGVRRPGGVRERAGAVDVGAAASATRAGPPVAARHARRLSRARRPAQQPHAARTAAGAGLARRGARRVGLPFDARAQGLRALEARGRRRGARVPDGRAEFLVRARRRDLRRGDTASGDAAAAQPRGRGAVHVCGQGPLQATAPVRAGPGGVLHALRGASAGARRLVSVGALRPRMGERADTRRDRPRSAPTRCSRGAWRTAEPGDLRRSLAERRRRRACRRRQGRSRACTRTRCSTRSSRSHARRWSPRGRRVRVPSAIALRRRRRSAPGPEPRRRRTRRRVRGHGGKSHSKSASGFMSQSSARVRQVRVRQWLGSTRTPRARTHSSIGRCASFAPMRWLTSVASPSIR